MSQRRSSSQLPLIIMILVMVLALALVYLVSAFVGTESNKHSFVPCPDSAHYLGGKHFKGTPTCGPEQQPVQENDPAKTGPTSHYTARQLEKMSVSQQVSCRKFREFISPNLTDKRFRRLHKLHPWGVARPDGCKLPVGMSEPFSSPDQTNGSGELNQPGDPGPIQNIPPTTLPPVN